MALKGFIFLLKGLLILLLIDSRKLASSSFIFSGWHLNVKGPKEERGQQPRYLEASFVIFDLQLADRTKDIEALHITLIEIGLVTSRAEPSFEHFELGLLIYE